MKASTLVLRLLAFTALCGSTWSSLLPASLWTDITQHYHLHIVHSAPNETNKLYSVGVAISGTGFHRQVHYAVSRAAGGQQPTQPPKQVLLIQYLPSSLFADPYQLEDVVRSKGNFTFRLFGPLDLELPAPACEPTALVLSFKMTQAADGAAHASLSIPLHAKYPDPQHFNGKATGFVERWSAGIVHVSLPGALIVSEEASTPQGGRPYQLFKPGQQAQNVESEAVWDVPCGDLDHGAVVAWGTSLTALFCCLLIVYSAVTRGTQ